MAGEYTLNPSMTIPEIINSLKTGKLQEELVFKLTIPEGKQLEQIAGIIAEKTNRSAAEVMKQLNDPSMIKSLMGKYPDRLTEDILDKDIKYPHQESGDRKEFFFCAMSINHWEAILGDSY